MDLFIINETVSNAAGKAQRQEGISAQSFLISLAVYGGIFLPAVFLFTFLKDINQRMFQPRCLVDKGVDALPKGRIVWVSHLRNLLRDEAFITEKYGLDCYFFLRLLQLALKILATIAIVNLPILLPVNYTSGSIRVSGIDKLSISNIETGESARCWVIAFVASLVNIQLCRVLLQECAKIVQVRQAYLHHPSRAGAVTPVLVTQIPPHMWDKKLLKYVYSAYNGGPVGVTLPRQRECESKENELSKELQYLENIQHNSIGRSTADKAISRVTQWIARKKLKSCVEWKIFNLQRDVERIKSVAVLHFADLLTAHLALQTRTSRVPHKMNNDVIYDRPYVDRSSVYQTWNIRALRTAAVTVILNLLAILWAVPIAMTGLLSQLVYLDAVSPHLEILSDTQLSVIQGLAPQAALSLLMYCFPFAIRYIAKLYPIFECSAIEVLIQRHYFIFLFTQVFLVVSISSSLTTMVPEIIGDIQSIPSILARNLPKSSNYFYSYFLLQVVTQCVMVLFRLPESLLLCAYNKPSLKQVQWSLVYPVFTNLLCICIIFSLIAPLILPIGLGMFTIFLVVYSYQIFFVFESSIDTAGLLYWEALNHVFVGIYTMNLFLLGLFILRNAFGPAALAAGLLVAVTLVQLHAHKTFKYLVKYISGNIFDDAADGVR
ncbi:hypothetical protein BDV35DRAFT_399650 [Aspergillus flavus]|uniref:DUF221 domain protein n=1 Tax=Aspergillus flavus TaxID=5059 RepID=A0A5N6GM83_ASPFL|nr:hypothetical protein BDV35DRAFT_399650 [Aspergillus flavus]